MANFFDANLRVLSRLHPALARRVRAETAAALPLCTLSDGQLDVQVNGQPFYRGDPAADTEATCRSLNIPYARFLVFYGTGLGYHVQRICRDMAQPNSLLLLVEPSLAMFRRALEATDWSELFAHPGIRFLVGLSLHDAYEECIHMFTNTEVLFLTPAIQPVSHVRSIEQHPEYYLRMAENFRSAGKEAALWFMAPAEDSYRGYMSFIRNLPEAIGQPSFQAMENLFPGYVGIAVSTGPSLKHSYAWLREVQHRAIIFCADSALKPLLREGITPHAVGCLERVPETALLFDELPPLPDTWLLSMPVIWPETYKKFTGPKIHYMRSVGFSPWFFPQAAIYDSGNSVSHLLLTALKRMGCARILLVGQDCAFDRNAQKTHVAGLPPLLEEFGRRHYQEMQDKSKTDDNSGLMIEGNNGQPILSSNWLIFFRAVIARFIARWDDACTVYNVIPKDYGAAIPGTVWCDPREATALLGPPCDIVATMRQALERSHTMSRADEQAFVEERLQLLDTRLDEMRLTVLQLLDSVSAYRHRYNPSIYPEEQYTPLWDRLQIAAGHLPSNDLDFYNDFIKTMIQREEYLASMKTEELMLRQGSASDRLDEKFASVFAWLDSIHTWSARLLHFLRTWQQERPFQTR